MTPSDVPYFFVSYSSGDRNIVYHVAHRIAERNIALWMDTENLQPGMNWYEEIKRGIQNAYGLIVFLSSTRIESEDSRSVVDTMFHEMALADERIVSVYLNSSAEIPWDLAEAKFVDLSDPARFEEGIEHLIEILETMLLESESTGKGIGLGAKDLEEYAQKTEQQIRRTARKELSSTPKSVFIVHGHDIGLRDEVEKYLSGQGVEAVVLSIYPRNRIGLE